MFTFDSWLQKLTKKKKIKMTKITDNKSLDANVSMQDEWEHDV